MAEQRVKQGVLTNSMYVACQAQIVIEEIAILREAQLSMTHLVLGVSYDVPHRYRSRASLFLRSTSTGLLDVVMLRFFLKKKETREVEKHMN